MNYVEAVTSDLLELDDVTRALAGMERDVERLRRERVRLVRAVLDAGLPVVQLAARMQLSRDRVYQLRDSKTY